MHHMKRAIERLGQYVIPWTVAVFIVGGIFGLFGGAFVWGQIRDWSLFWLFSLELLVIQIISYWIVHVTERAKIDRHLRRMAQAFLEHGGAASARMASDGILDDLVPDVFDDERGILFERVNARVLRCYCPFWDERSIWLQVIRELAQEEQYQAIPKRLVGIEESGNE